MTEGRHRTESGNVVSSLLFSRASKCYHCSSTNLGPGPTRETFTNTNRILIITLLGHHQHHSGGDHRMGQTNVGTIISNVRLWGCEVAIITFFVCSYQPTGAVKMPGWSHRATVCLSLCQTHSSPTHFLLNSRNNGGRFYGQFEGRTAGYKDLNKEIPSPV